MGMRKYLSVLIIAFASLFAVLAATTFIADANNYNTAYEIDDDLRLPQCTYSLLIANDTFTPGVHCNREVTFVDNIPDPLEAGIFNDVYYSASGTSYEVQCSHTTAQTVCVLGRLIVVEPAQCDDGFFGFIDADGRLTCIVRDGVPAFTS